MSTNTCTSTTSITSADVRHVMRSVSQEMRAICQAAAHVALDFDADSAETDLAMLALQEAASGFSLQFYLDGELVREYVYCISDNGSLTPGGLSADAPPTGYIPEGTRIRLTATPNPNVETEHREDWFKLLGWSGAKPLVRPQGVVAQTYGAFASQSFGVTRSVLVNPKFDQPVTATQSVRKGTGR